MTDYLTKTGQWNLVVHRVSDTTAEVWVGTLFPTLKMPDQARVDLITPDGDVISQTIDRKDWQRPFRNVNQRFYVLCTFKNLQARTHYKVDFWRHIEPCETIIPAAWQKLRSGEFDTLPASLPQKNDKPFVIGLGSCFYNHRDGGQAAGAYRALYQRGAPEHRPEITVLAGDQVYLDIGFDSLSMIPKEIRHRIADDYALHWQALGSLLGSGGTWMLPDDHEYWNDFPFYKTPIPALWALRLPHVRSQWRATAKDGVENVQRSPAVEVVNIGSNLSLCFADLRSRRSKHQFINTEGFKQLIAWAKRLQTPGVLVIPQLLIDSPDKTECNLLSFKKQYTKLLEALASSGNDIAVLTGDVHFGRICQVEMGEQGAKLVEIVASPMSNLTGLNGIATAKAKPLPEYFPDYTDIKVKGWPARKVTYDTGFFVSHKKGRLLSAYPKARTREHFMTVAFQQENDAGDVKMTVEAWRIRERDKAHNLPVRDFDQPFEVILRRNA